MKIINKPLCIIPARGNSKRFPLKNIALLKGKPLVSYSIEAAIGSNIFETICVSSESKTVLNIASSYTKVECKKRPIQLSCDTSTVKEVCLYIIHNFLEQKIMYENFAVLLPTSPLRVSTDIQNAYNIFEKTKTSCLMSMIPFSHPPQRAIVIKNNKAQPFFGIKYMKRTQELEQLYRHDGSIIFIKTKQFLEKKEFHGSNITPFFLPIERSVDIDNPLDLAWADFLLTKQILTTQNKTSHGSIVTL